MINPASMQAQGLVGWWPFSEGAGIETTDSSGYNNTGTLDNATWDGPGVVKFNGTNSRINVPASPSLDITGSEISFGGWVYPSVLPGYALIVGKDAGSISRQYAVYLSTTSPSYVYVALYGATPGASGKNYLLNRPWVVGQWNHVFVCYKNGIGGSIYLNGTEAYYGAWTGNITTLTADIHMGREGVGTYPLPGFLKDIRIYNRYLFPEDVQQVYTNPDGLFKKRLFVIPPPVQALDGIGRNVARGSNLTASLAITLNAGTGRNASRIAGTNATLNTTVQAGQSRSVAKASETTTTQTITPGVGVSRTVIRAGQANADLSIPLNGIARIIVRGEQVIPSLAEHISVSGTGINVVRGSNAATSLAIVLNAGDGKNAARGEQANASLAIDLDASESRSQAIGIADLPTIYIPTPVSGTGKIVVRGSGAALSVYIDLGETVYILQAPDGVLIEQAPDTVIVEYL